VVVHDLDVKGVTITPAEAHSPLVVYPYAALPLPRAAQRFESIAGRHAKIRQRPSPVKQQKLPPSNPLEGAETAHSLIPEQPLGVPAAKAPDHSVMLFRIAEYVNRNRARGPSLRRHAH
jgi:hypothetical protein